MSKKQLIHQIDEIWRQHVHHAVVEDKKQDSLSVKIANLISQEQLSLLKKFEGVLGEDESEVQDFDRQLYFVGKNDLRYKVRIALEKLKKEYE